MGSVKDLQTLSPASHDSPGIGRFTFSDRYSVFDWGEMPDQIKNKGTALTMIGAFFFEELEKKGYKTHYHGLVENGQAKKLSDLQAPSNIMEVDLVNVIKPAQTNSGYDYSGYADSPVNCLVPLEVIYRNSLPAGSSVFKRLKNGSITPKDLGLDSMPEPGQRFDPPLLDVSTKLESIDRYINWKEAMKISGLSEQKLQELKDLTLQTNQMITNTVSSAGLTNEDGKFEFGLDPQGNLLVLDVLGTPDECRFLFEGMPVSKEIARIHYRNSEWFNKIEEAKIKNPKDWRSTVEPPPPLPLRLAELISRVYTSFCNTVTEKKWFDSPDLGPVLKEIKEFMPS